MAADSDELEKIARTLIHDARAYASDDLHPALEAAWRYYHGQVSAPPSGFVGQDERGNPVYEGSAAVMTECRDAVESVLPDLLRIFAGSDEIAEYRPRREEDVEGARQATDYIMDVFLNQNDGFRVIYDSVKDWLVKVTAIRCWHEETESWQKKRFEGLDEDAMALLKGEAEEADDIELEADPYEETIEIDLAYAQQRYAQRVQAIQAQAMQAAQQGTPQQPGQPPQPPQMPQIPPFDPARDTNIKVTLYRGEIRKRETKHRLRVDTVRQEEILIDSEAQDLVQSRLVGVDAILPVADVVAMGIPEEDVLPFARSRDATSQWTVRQAKTGILTGYDSQTHEKTSWVRVVDAIIRVDMDGDGYAEERRVIALGDQAEIYKIEDDPDYALIIGSPYLVNGAIIGRGMVELTSDLQETETQILRRTLDNLNKSTQPRWATKSETAIQDLMSWFDSPVVRAAPDDVSLVTMPFSAQAAFPVLELMQSRSAMRTGVSGASQGLNPNALKGQTLEGANAIIAAPQSRTECLARVFGETILRHVFIQLLKLSIRYQDKPQTVRLRNKWVTVDPRQWDEEMDVDVRVGLGTGTRAERLVGLNMILEHQQALMLSPVASQLVTPAELRNTLADMCAAVGLKDVDRYFKQVEPGQPAANPQAEMAQKALEQEAQVAIQKETIRANAKQIGDQAKLQADAQAKAAELQQRGQEKMVELQLEHDLRQKEMLLNATDKLHARSNTNLNMAPGVQ